jgi:hypothetical protein
VPRPAVLVVDPEAPRRKELARGLAELGYEVVPAIDAQQGMRFAEKLGPGVVVAPVSFALDGGSPFVARFVAQGSGPESARHTLLLIGQGEQEGRDLPEEVLFLDAAGLESAELVRRIHLVLLGREVGVEADAPLESLVGDLSLLPLLELLRGLNRAHATGRVICAEGKITLEEGAVVGAAAGGGPADKTI